MTAIKQTLFGQAGIGEEEEDGETSVYNVQLEVEDLHELDNDFSELNITVEEESEVEEPATKSPKGHATNKGMVDGLCLLWLAQSPGQV